MRPSLSDIVWATERQTGVSAQAIASRARRMRTTTARHLVWYVANVIYGISQNSIAERMGRDHTTVRHGCRRIQSRVETERGLMEQAESIASAALNRVTLRAVDAMPASADPVSPQALAPSGPKIDPCAPVRIVGAVCSPEWWASNDANFRAGVRRAAAAAADDKLSRFIHMGKSARDLPLVALDSKSVLALPRNLCSGLQRPTPDPTLIQGA